MPRLPPEYATWMGRIKTPEEFRDRYGVDVVHYVEELPAAMAAAPLVHLMSGLNTDSGSVSVPASFPGLEDFEDLGHLPESNSESNKEASKSNKGRKEAARLHPVLSECRVVKSASELALMRWACRVSSAAHIAAMRAAQAGMFEYQARVYRAPFAPSRRRSDLLDLLITSLFQLMV